MDVTCSYLFTPDGTRRLVFAGDLAQRLGGKLRVVVDAPPPGLCTGPHAIRQDVQRKTGLDESGFTLVFQRGPYRAVSYSDTLVVDGGLIAGRSDVSVLVPFCETGINARGDGPIVLPFGDGESALNAAVLGLELAVALRKQVIFYHTTWRESSVASLNAEDHMCEKASVVRRILESYAHSSKLVSSTIIEMADDIASGAIAYALGAKASLICTARGRKVGMGSHVDQLLEESPVPVLVVGR